MNNGNNGGSGCEPFCEIESHVFGKYSLVVEASMASFLGSVCLYGNLPGRN